MSACRHLIFFSGNKFRRKKTHQKLFSEERCAEFFVHAPKSSSTFWCFYSMGIPASCHIWCNCSAVTSGFSGPLHRCAENVITTAIKHFVTPPPANCLTFFLPPPIGTVQYLVRITVLVLCTDSWVYCGTRQRYPLKCMHQSITLNYHQPHIRVCTLWITINLIH